MASRNPISGGPDFIAALRNALEQTPGAYARPPPTGGTQISSRFGEDRLALLDALSTSSGWNRNQIINAFVDKGLFELFRQISDSAMEKIMTQTTDKIIPTFNPAADKLHEIAAFTRFRIFPVPRRLRENRPAQPLETWALGRIDSDRGIVEFHEATQLGRSLPVHAVHIERIHPDTAQDSQDSFKNAMVELNVQFVFTDKRLEMLPISDDLSPLKRRRT